MDTAQSVEPRAWVGCLGCYNDGRLVGEWLGYYGAGDLEGSLLRTVEFGQCVKCGSDEFQCFDVENVPGLGECSVSEFLRVCESLQRIGEEFGDSEREAFLVLLDNEHESLLGDIDELLERFRDSYVGEWQSVADFSEEYYESTVNLGSIPSTLRSCIDWEHVWQYELRFDFWEESGHFFRNI